MCRGLMWAHIYVRTMEINCTAHSVGLGQYQTVADTSSQRSDSVQDNLIVLLL